MSEHDKSFDSIKRQTARSTRTAHPKADHALCLFTDASETHWSGILTQVPNDQLKRPLEEQEHEPLSFLSGSFTGASYGWSVPEREGFAVVESMCKLDYLVMGRRVAIFTDHANLVYLFDPHGQNPGIPRHTASKLMQWALKLSAFRYVIEHLAGERNVWADMFSRWAVQLNRKLSALKLNSLLVAPITPSIDSRLDRPKAADIITSQAKRHEQPPSRFEKVNDIWQDKRGVVWIPSPDRLLRLRIMVAGHTGYGGHRGYRTTQVIVTASFWWKEVMADVEHFVKSCLHCLATETGESVPRPMGHAVHGDKPNTLLNFDYCYMMKGVRDLTYVLILKDDFSGYVWLRPTRESDASTTAQALLDWFASFGVVQNWVSDRGTHFKNDVVRALREQTGGSHHFTLAYCPWSNGTVEVVCRELLRATRALLSEFQFPHRSWPDVMPVVQSVLNSSPLQCLGRRCALNVFTGLPQDTPLRSVTTRMGGSVRVRSIDEVNSKRLVRID